MRSTSRPRSTTRPHRALQVVNLSLTFRRPRRNSPDIEILRRAVAAAQAAGVLVVGASGNENYNGVAYPAKLPGVLAVGASTRTIPGLLLQLRHRLDLVAPGEGIISTLFAPGPYSYGYFAAPARGPRSRRPTWPGRRRLCAACAPI